MSYLDYGTLGRLALRSLSYAFRPAPVVRIVRDVPAEPPAISVIIATYNWSSVLRLAIQSVLWQTEQNFEVLVIGDGCTDDTEAVVRSTGDARLYWHNLPRNNGHQAAPNNAGLAIAKGKYVALLGHDDIWHPDHLKTLLGAAIRADADVASAITQIIGPKDSNVRVISGMYPRSGRFHPTVRLMPSGLMVRRDMVRRMGGWTDYRATAKNPDVEFVDRLIDAGARFVSTGEMTVSKFPSALRKNSYLEKPCHEQAACLRQIETRRWFMLAEAAKIANIHIFRRPMSHPTFTSPPDSSALGWEVTQYRKFRGLE